MLSVIIPAYNEEQMIQKINRIISSMLSRESINYEIIFVNDGSSDNTWQEICYVGKQYPTVRAVSFSKNFGKDAAIFAGMKCAEGDCCVFIDCDLQHPPELIISMYRLWQEGYEIVEGIKSERGKESFIHKLAAKCFYCLISCATGMEMRNASDFKLLDRKVVDVLLDMPERQVFFRALSSWVGFKSTTILFEVQKRQNGTSKWSVFSLIKYALNNIASFSAAPMQMVTVTGIVFLLFSLILGMQTLAFYYMGKALEGFSTVIILLLIVGSILMLSLGIIGYYISKIYNEIKGRPRYIVTESLNGNMKNNMGSDCWNPKGGGKV